MSTSAQPATSLSPSLRPTRIQWLAIALILMVLGAGLYLWRRPPAPIEPAAFLLPVDPFSRARLGGWRTLRLTTTHAVHSGTVVHVPEGSRVRVVHADGRLEEVSGPRDISISGASGSAELHHFHSALPRLIAELQPNEARVVPPVRIASPADLTRYLNPLVTWEASPEATYDVAIVDPADPRTPPRVAEKVRPPVKFADLLTPQNKQLPPDRVHQVLIFEHGIGVPVGTMQFLTSADAKVAEPPSDLGELFAEATTALAKRPLRTGDAWVALQRLPAEWANSELALRLKMKAAAELGLDRELYLAKQAGAGKK